MSVPDARRFSWLVLLAATLLPLPARALVAEARETAGRLAWFQGQTRLVMEAGRREPVAAILSAVEQRADALLPAGALDPRSLTAAHQTSRQQAAQELEQLPLARRELQAVAARAGQPPRLRAAAAIALAELHSELAPFSLAVALAEQEDPAIQQMLSHELLDALQRTEATAAPSDLERQMFYLCRRIAWLTACEHPPETAARQLGEELRRLEASGEQAAAASLASSTLLPSACLSRYLVDLTALPGPDSGEQVWRALLAQAAARLGRARLRHEPEPDVAAQKALLGMLEQAFTRLSDARALSSATSLLLLLHQPSETCRTPGGCPAGVAPASLLPALESALPRAQLPDLARFIRVAIARLKGTRPALGDLP